MAVTLVPIPLRSVVMPAPPPMAEFLAGTAVWQPTSVTSTNWGTLQLLIDGTDVSLFRGAPFVCESWQSQEPFGDSQGIVDFPQIFQFDPVGRFAAGDTAWCFTGASAVLNLVRPDTSTKVLFAGYVQIDGDGYAQQAGSGTSTTNGSAHFFQLTLQGTMYQLGLAELTPYFALNTQDAGVLIAKAVNGVVGPRFNPLALPTTTVASGSNGVDVTSFTGSGTLHVGSTAAIVAMGSTAVQVVTSSGVAIITFTGDTGTTFTGCTTIAQGSGILSTDNLVTAGTGFPIAADGSFTTVLEYVQDTLGQCTTIDGASQWTLSCDNSTSKPTPSLALKDVQTIDWTVDAGVPGVDTSGLTDDVSSNYNVMYGSGTTAAGLTTPFNLDLFGVASGFDPGGQVWKNSAYPGLTWTGSSPQPLQPFPFSSPSATMTIGTTNAATSTGDGVSILQSRIGTPVTGTYNSTDAAEVSSIQTADGLTVDGVVGAQTWVAIWATATGGAVVLPLYLWEQSQISSGPFNGYYQSPVDPDLWDAYGDRLVGYNVVGNPHYSGANYDPSILRVEGYIGMGAGITLAEAKNRAKALVNRDFAGSWAGTIILTTDPHEGSRFEIRAGDNVMLNYLHGATTTIGLTTYPGLLFHVNQVDVAFDNTPSMTTGVPTDQPPLSVTLTVDTAARDSITSKAYVSHTPGSSGDPVRRADVLKRKSRLTNDTVVQFDAAAGAGIIPLHPIRAGKWTALQIPFAQVGQISRVSYVTTDAASEFYLAVFNKKTTPLDMITILGSGGDPTQSQIWQTQAAPLINAGCIVSWGGDDGSGLQPCGYWPLTEQQGGSLTGQFMDSGNWNYHSADPPWLWVLEYSPDSCNIQGVFEQLGSVGASPA